MTKPIIRRSMGKRVEWYPYVYVYRGRRTVLVWRSSKHGDCFKLTAGRKLFAAASEAQMKRLLGKEGQHVLWANIATLDFDRFWVALRSLRAGRASSKRTCDLLLDGWNFIEDLLKTSGSRAEAKRLRTRLLDKAYDKLFYGINLPSVTPPGRSYSPLWTREETLALRKEIRAVWQHLRKDGFIVP